MKHLRDTEADVERACKSFLNLHDTISALLVLGPPLTALDWSKRVELAARAFQRHKVPGLQSGAASYTVQWLLRTVLHAQLVSSQATLDVSEALAIELPGPDENGHLARMAEAFDAEMAPALLEKVGYTGPPHLFSMELCLASGRPEIQLSNPGERKLAAVFDEGLAWSCRKSQRDLARAFLF